MKMRRRTKLLVFVFALILVLIALYSGLHYLESTVLYHEQEATPVQPSKTITRNGKDYFPRQDITVMLIMGIDEPGPVRDSMSYNNSGEADVVMLVIFDEVKESYSVMMLNRDTMMEIPITGLNGKPAGTKFAQLALSHTYGSGLEDSCENTKNAVSAFLNDIYIDYYLAVNMDAIPIMNDAVGGVWVTVTDNFADVDSSIQTGEMVLRGQQAMNFIQMRKGVGDQLNISRMQRQREYMNGFVDALNQKMEESDSFVVDAYEEIAPYVVSDCSVTTLSNLINRFSAYTLTEITTPEGDNHKGNEFMEFYVDEAKLDELIIRLFYAEK